MSRIAQLDLRARESFGLGAPASVRMARGMWVRPNFVRHARVRVAICRVTKHAPPD